MQPFWLVRRLTEAGLKSYTSQNKAAKFNMKLIPEEFQEMSMGSWQEQSLSLVYKVTVPMLTNSYALKAGDELILQKLEQKLDKPQFQNWRSELKVREQEQAAAGKAKAKAKAKGNGTTLDVLNI